MRGPKTHDFVYTHTRYVSFERVVRNRVHRHSFYEPCIVIAGSGEFEHDGTVFPLRAGDLFVADPGVFHEVRSLSTRNLELYFLAFSLMQRAGDGRARHRAATVQRLLADFVLDHQSHLSGQSHLVPLFEHTMQLGRQPSPNGRSRFHDEATRLLLEQIVEGLTDSARLSATDSDEHATRNRIVSAIEAGLDRPLRIAGLARRCGMSERTLRRRWAALGTRPLVDEVNHRRVERACGLLRLPDVPVAEIGFQVGIGSPAQFSRLFRTIKGLSPREYRRRYLGKLPGATSGGPPFRTEFLDGDTKEYAS